MLDFLLPFWEYGADWGPRLLGAAVVTLRISVFGFLLAAGLGLIIALLRIYAVAPLAALARFYITILRGVPVLAVLLLFYFGFPGLGVNFSAEGAAITGLGLAFAAQMAEVYRAGFVSIPRGHWEAAMAVGLTPLQAMRKIMLPQVWRTVQAPVLVTFVTLLKDSSLASLIAVNELILEGRSLSTEYFLPLHIYMFVGALYFFMVFPLSLIARRLARQQRVGMA